MSEGAFEARVSGKRETKDGVFIVLQVQPDDYYNTPLKELRFNSFLQIGWAEIVDTSVHKIEVPVGRLEDEPPNAVMPKKDKRRFADLPASQQAAIRCGDEEFVRFLRRSETALWETATDKLFDGESLGDEDIAPEAVRIICGVKSRRDIPSNPVALERWQTLEKRYQDWLADKNYSGSINK